MKQVLRRDRSQDETEAMVRIKQSSVLVDDQGKVPKFYTEVLGSVKK